jgi:hypothetical protein
MPLFEISSRAKGSTGAGQDHQTYLAIGLDIGEKSLEITTETEAESVEGGRAVQRCIGNLLPLFNQESLVRRQHRLLARQFATATTASKPI